MEAYEKGLAEAARRAAAEHMEALYNSMDRMLCSDIVREKKYTAQRHDTRELLTVTGPVRFTHTLFRNKEDGSYHYLLDEWLGLKAHERLSCAAEAAILTEAVKSSYDRAARTLGKDARISKTTVMDKVHGIQVQIPIEKPEKKKYVEYLCLEADEDHIHKQEKKPPEKKNGMIGKLLYLYEGREEKNGRRELSHVFYLGGLYPGSEENHRLFRHRQKYIETNYETRYLKKVYVSGDCGAWIKVGVSDIDKGVMVMDKYHLMKYINRAASQMLDDTNAIKGRLWKALYKGKNGCSAEGHVSHVYSDRMSSGPMGWSEAGADAMCRLRCYVRDYGEEKIIDLVRRRREQKGLQARGTEEAEPKFARGYMQKLLHGQHDSDRVYLEKMQATIPSIEIRKKLAIRERLSNI